MKYKGKRFLVVGLADSGLGACKLLLNQGAEVVGTDLKTSVKEAFQDPVLSRVKLVIGEHPLWLLDNLDHIIISPGVPLSIPLISEAIDRKIPIWGELELAYQNCQAPIIAVSETHGKSTTVSLIYQILREAGMNVGLGGNIRPALSEVINKVFADGYLVVEVSSFQLETIAEFRPRIGIILNIFPDHLDRHQNLSNFENIISKLFVNMRTEDLLIGNLDDNRVVDLMKRTYARKAYFSLSEHHFEGAFVKNNYIFTRFQNKLHEIMPVSEISLPGNHNLQNALAAICATQETSITYDYIVKVLKEFKGLPHRLQIIKEINRVVYINDSKATTPHATIIALKAISKPKHLILGGLDKDISFHELAEEVLKHNVLAIYLIGKAKHKIASALSISGFTNYFVLDNLMEAVGKVHANAKNGDVVLLSPACASFDQFKDFEERGKKFQELVNELT